MLPVALAFLLEDGFGLGPFLGGEGAVAVGVKALEQGDFAFGIDEFFFFSGLVFPGFERFFMFFAEGSGGGLAFFGAEGAVLVGVKAGQTPGFAGLGGWSLRMKGEKQEESGDEEKMFHGKKGKGWEWNGQGWFNLNRGGGAMKK